MILRNFVGRYKLKVISMFKYLRKEKKQKEQEVLHGTAESWRFCFALFLNCLIAVFHHFLSYSNKGFLS